MARTKQDRARIALKQKHEVDYINKLCKRFLEYIDGNAVRIIDKKKTFYMIESRLSPGSIARICNAFLKITKCKKH